MNCVFHKPKKSWVELCVHSGGTLTTAEGVRVGHVSFGVYREYFASVGGMLFVFLSVLIAFSSATLLALSNAWLSEWSNNFNRIDTKLGVLIYVALGAASLVLTFALNIHLARGAVRASTCLHEKLLRKVVE